MPDERDGGDETLTTTLRAPAGLCERLADACRRKHIGLNDAFLAALTIAIAANTRDRDTSRHRRRLALGTALNGRGLAPDGLRDWFGNCLGDMLVLVRRPDAGLEDVAAQIAAQTRRQKARRFAALSVSAARVFFIRHIWPLFNVPHTRRSYRKLFPVCAGVTTVVVDPSRFGHDAASVSRYVRACPPGPAMPIVLAPTIFDGRLELGLVYRKACMIRGQGRALLERVLAGLQELAAMPRVALETPTPV